MMFHLGNDDLVTGRQHKSLAAVRQVNPTRRLQSRIEKCVGYEIDALCGVLREHQLVRGSADELGDPSAG